MSYIAPRPAGAIAVADETRFPVPFQSGRDNAYPFGSAHWHRYCSLPFFVPLALGGVVVTLSCFYDVMRGGGSGHTE
jgi:hypothetical protein